MATKPEALSLTGQAQRARWRRWLSRLEGDLTTLVISHHFFETVGGIVRANPKAKEPGDFHAWLIRNYAITAAVTIRRLMDHDNRSVSLLRLLREIGASAECITRQSYVSHYRQDLRPAAHCHFDRLAGKHRTALPASQVRRDIRRLNAAHRRIRTIVNKRFAHLDQRNMRRRQPTIRELHEVAAMLEATFKKYDLLLRARGGSGLLPTWQYDWTEIFRVPWIPSKGEQAERVAV